MSKLCGPCGRVLDENKFHKRAASPDGLASKCKECQQLYDAKRLHEPHRIKARKLYRESSRGKKRQAIGRSDWVEQNPEKRKAHVAVGNALRDGKLIKQPCERCGTADGVEAHHPDYSKPLEVMWLCVPHHAEQHRLERWSQRFPLGPGRPPSMPGLSETEASQRHNNQGRNQPKLE